VGVVLQHVLPRLMTEQAPRETIFEQIDHVLDLLRAEAIALVESVAGPLQPAAAPAAAAAAAAPAAPPAAAAGGGAAGAKAPRPGSEPLKTFFLEQARPWLEAARPPRAPFDRPTAATMQRAHVKRLVPPDLHEAVDDLFEICEERRQIERQRRLHLWLHGWLFVHAPISWALLAGALFHSVWALRY
jgi:hypothetical protein